jgi:hypothetical protein
MTMPDIQTELQKLIQAWEQPETTQPTETTEEPMFTPTTNTSRATFELVRDNPYKTKREYIRMLELKGFKKSSTSSLLAQMIRQKNISIDDMGLLHTNLNEYKPLKSAATMKNKAKKAKPAKTSKVITSDAPVDTGIARLIDRPVRSKVDTILDDISLSDAHELYRQLHKYFGGLPK